MQKNREIDLPRLGMNSGMVEKSGQATQKLSKDPTDDWYIEMANAAIRFARRKSETADSTQVYPHVL